MKIALVSGIIKNDIKFDPQKKSCKLQMVSYSVFKDENGDYKKDIFNCVAFGNTAQNLTDYAKKNDYVEIYGELISPKFKDVTGASRLKTEIKILNFSFPMIPKEQLDIMLNKINKLK